MVDLMVYYFMMNKSYASGCDRQFNLLILEYLLPNITCCCGKKIKLKLLFVDYTHISLISCLMKQTNIEIEIK